MYVIMKNKIINNRLNHIGPNFSLHYNEPIHLVKSKGMYLYDINGKKYLDAIGNINIVGHCNDHVVESIYKQASILNTNTRYLYNIMEEYSEKLLKYFPKKLSVIYFVCSGSEANDLALRMANNFTNGSEYIVIDNAYHGHTDSLINLSPYKFKSKGGQGRNSNVHILDMPDAVRGKYRFNENQWINKYINEGKELIDNVAFNKKISAFFSESILGCGGQIILPPNYLKQIFNKIKSNNGVCVSDEVQTGFGRIGKNFWAFEEQKVIPDICTVGKPMGNGHPIAAVITTREIADSFNNGMEYFNSFGGNPVSLAAGKAVLEVIENNKLQENAQKIGNYLKIKFNDLKNKFPDKICDVRGEGLFIGVDLVEKGNPDLPDSKIANFIINHSKKLGLLLSTDGPYDNVVKIKPPLIINIDEANYLIECLDKSINYYINNNI
ncbi:MAG: aspartate aminotransferase family protein [Pelagibacteraceae bacterium]|nr:aspartate aminotransferase family protein [Pelagibacteraceae bacterium]PPR51123.1 MAG: Acetylornithine/acetyl-lysine aminotransferase [Alphaproteobacteria bacterium MarineAlpha5_Bin10]|tara:strand:+ start:2222 stop:3535 length:1314 start_codon:yes stop_codon:yes gene_type:complete